jgi:hypothetical protein
LRQPSFLGLREDKPARDVKRERVHAQHRRSPPGRPRTR